MSEEELLQTLTLIFSAAIESMVDLLLNGTAALLAHPAQADALRHDPGLAASAVEEALRYDAPVQGIGRIAAADYELGGVHHPPEATSWPCWARATGIRPGSPARTRSTSPGQAHHRCRSAAVCTTAWARRWPGCRPRCSSLRC